jgi:hypothetical protein
MIFDEFGSMLQQIPAGLIVQVCGSFLLLVGAFMYFAAIKPELRKRREKQKTAATGTDEYDLPDLDLLTERAPTVQESSPVISAPAPTPPAPPPPAPPVRRPGEYTVRLSDGSSTRADEMLTILRDQDDERLIVLLDGTGYRTLVDQPEVKQRFARLMKELAEVVATEDTRPPAARPVEREADADSVPPPMPAEAPAVPAPEPVRSYTNGTLHDDDLDDLDLDAPDLDDLSRFDDPAPRVSPPPAPPKPAAKPTMPPPPPSMNGPLPGDLPKFRDLPQQEKIKPGGLFRQPRAEIEPVPELNIAGAIEAYLQHKLRQTPDYYGRSIHVHSAPGGGVMIEVDGEYFEAVSDVYDPEVRDFISTAIQEWQERQ